MEIIISEKGTRSNQALFRSAVLSKFSQIASGLKAEVNRIELTEGGWVRVIFSGEDEEVLAEALRQQFGEIPIKLANIVRGRVYRGWITKPVGYGIYVDIGLLSPRKDALYPLYACRAQLCDGDRLPTTRISEMFGLIQDLPVSVWVDEVEDGASTKITVQLSEWQEKELREWRELPFHRVLVLGSLRQEVNDAVEASGCKWDLARIHSISLTVHVLTCKIGTQAPGIIAKIGPKLRGTKLFPVFPNSRFH